MLIYLFQKMGTACKAEEQRARARITSAGVRNAAQAASWCECTHLSLLISVFSAGCNMVVLAPDELVYIL